MTTHFERRAQRYPSSMRFDRTTVFKAAGVALPVVFGLVVGRLLSPWLPPLAVWMHTLGIWAPFAFLAAYVTVVLLMLSQEGASTRLYAGGGSTVPLLLSDTVAA